MALGIPCLYSTPLLAAPAGGSRFQGCFLTSGSDDFLDKLKLLSSSGDKEVDQVCSAAEQELRREFRVAPDTWYFDDVEGRNAFATWFVRRRPGVLSRLNSKDGTVCLGTRLVRQVTRRDELNRRWKTRLTAIIAHEWAHIVQFSRGYRNAGKSVELHADFLAGWFLGRTSGARTGFKDQERGEAMIRFFGLGDYEIYHPEHHGTPKERAFVIADGFDLASKVYNVDAAFRARSLNG
jgi:hypothetical protein